MPKWYRRLPLTPSDELCRSPENRAGRADYRGNWPLGRVSATARSPRRRAASHIATGCQATGGRPGAIQRSEQPALADPETAHGLTRRPADPRKKLSFAAADACRPGGQRLTTQWIGKLIREQISPANTTE